MLLYILPIVIFVIISSGLYTISNDKEKNNPSNIVIRNVLPAIVIGVLVFVFMNYRKNTLIHEPVMSGNYFDTPVLQT